MGKDWAFSCLALRRGVGDKSPTTSQSTVWEGCLSIPGIRGLVPRYKCVRAKAAYTIILEK
ncbi:MAG: peptide deformylase [Pseudomonadota bacterium]